MTMMARPPIPAPPYAGGCLCGALRYSLAARPRAVNACHCLDCKKLSGSTHFLSLMFDRAAFSANGAPLARYRKRADSGREIDIIRCANCGTRLWHEPQANPELVFVVGGTLDDPSWVVPASHIWTKHASPSVIIPDDAYVCAVQPETRQLTFDAFTRIYGTG